MFICNFEHQSIKLEPERIIEILERMEKNQEDFFARMEVNLSCSHVGNEEWIDGLEVQNLLGITRKTVYRLTINGTLKPRRLGRRNYFSKSSIFDLRNRFLK